MERGQRDSEHFGDLGFREASEESELHAGRGPWIQCFELRQGFVNVQDVDVGRMRQPGGRRQRDPHIVAAPLPGTPGASVVDQNTSQLPRGDGKEVCAILPLDGLGRRKQLQVQLADQFRCLKCVIGSLVMQVASCEATEMIVGSGHQLLASFLAAASPIDKQRGQVRLISGHYGCGGPLSKSRLRGLVASFD